MKIYLDFKSSCCCLVLFFQRLHRAQADEHVERLDANDVVQVGRQRGEPHRDPERQLVR